MSDKMKKTPVPPEIIDHFVRTDRRPVLTSLQEKLEARLTAAGGAELARALPIPKILEHQGGRRGKKTENAKAGAKTALSEAGGLKSLARAGLKLHIKAGNPKYESRTGSMQVGIEGAAAITILADLMGERMGKCKPSLDAMVDGKPLQGFEDQDIALALLIGHLAREGVEGAYNHLQLTAGGQTMLANLGTLRIPAVFEALREAQLQYLSILTAPA